MCRSMVLEDLLVYEANLIDPHSKPSIPEICDSSQKMPLKGYFIRVVICRNLVYKEEVAVSQLNSTATLHIV